MGTTLVHPILTSHTHPSPTVSSGTAQERAFCANTNARIRSFEFLRILGQALGLSTSGFSQTMSYPDIVQGCLSTAVELSNGLPYPRTHQPDASSCLLQHQLWICAPDLATILLPRWWLRCRRAPCGHPCIDKRTL